MFSIDCRKSLFSAHLNWRHLKYHILPPPLIPKYLEFSKAPPPCLGRYLCMTPNLDIGTSINKKIITPQVSYILCKRKFATSSEKFLPTVSVK